MLLYPARAVLPELLPEAHLRSPVWPLLSAYLPDTRPPHNYHVLTVDGHCVHGIDSRLLLCMRNIVRYPSATLVFQLDYLSEEERYLVLGNQSSLLSLLIRSPLPHTDCLFYHLIFEILTP